MNIEYVELCYTYTVTSHPKYLVVGSYNLIKVDLWSGIQ